MRKIIIVCPSSGRFSDTPCGKDMYNLAKYISENYTTQVEMLTTLSDEQNDTSYKKMKIHTIKSYKDILNDTAKKYQTEKNIIKKTVLRAKVYVAKRNVVKNNVARYVMDFKELKKWVALQDGSYDMVISVSHPFYVHALGKYVFKKLHVKKWVAYFLDPYADNNEVRPGQLKKRIEDEKQVFEECTDVFCTEEFFLQRKNSLIGNYLNKVQFIPTHLLKDNTTPNTSGEKEGIHFVFSGMFYEDIRNPQKLLECFLRLPDEYYLHLYCKGCQDVLEQYKECLGDRLLINGYITDQEEYSNMMKSMDVFINIGNTIANQVPSKILNYFSFGKPVLHFKNCTDDPVEKKYHRYPLMKVIDYNENRDVVIKQMQVFSEQVRGRDVGFETVKTLFADSTIEKTCEKIIEVMDV